MNLNALKQLAIKHGPSFLTSLSCFGVAFTGYLVHRADMKCIPDITEAILFKEDSDTPIKEIEKKVIREHAKDYIPAFAALVFTIACGIGANQWHISKETALVGTALMYKKGSEELEKSLSSKYGPEKVEEVKRELAERKLDNDRPPWVEKIPDKMKIWEPYTQQWFYASQKDILWSEICINKKLAQTYEVTLNDLLALYGCRKTKEGEKIGWSYNDECFTQVWAAQGGLYGCWIDLCPQTIENQDGTCFMQMEYGVHPADLADING